MRIRDLGEVKETLRSLARLEEILPAFGIPVQSVGQTHYKAVCPFHTDTDPSLSIHAEKQLYRCHGCKVGGDVFSFAQAIETLSFIEAVERLAGIVGYDLTPHMRDLTPEEQEEERLCQINQSIWDSLEPCPTSWRTTRQFSSSVLTEYGVRFSSSLPQTSSLSKSDRARLGFDRRGQWNNAIVVPIRDLAGRIVAFRNRPLERTEKGPKVIGPGEGHPLTLPPLYGLFEARSAIRSAGGRVIVVEGEPDIWQMVSHGIGNVCGAMTTRLGDDQLALLHAYGIREVVYLPDGDKGGRESARRVAEAPRKSPVMVKIGRLEEGDPDEVLLREGRDTIDAAISQAKHSFEYLINSVLSGIEVQSITDRVDALMELRPYFSTAPEYERSLAADELAHRLDMTADAVEDFFREGDSSAPLQNVRAEAVVLGSMISDEEFIGEALQTLRPEHFFLARHQRLFKAIQYLYTTSDVVNHDTLTTYLRNKRFDASMVRLVDQVMANCDEDSRAYMLRDVHDKAMRREVQRQARDVANRIADTSVETRDLLGKFSGSLAASIVGGEKLKRGAAEVTRSVMSMVMERVRNPKLITGFDIGPDWQSLNSAMRGLQPKKLTVISAPTTVGKTAVAGCWARYLAVEQDIPVDYYTYETDDEDIDVRMLAAMSGVESDKIVTGYMAEDEVRLVQDAAVRLAASPLEFSRAGPGLHQLIAAIRHSVTTRGTKVVFVDYAQLMHVEGYDPRGGRHNELGVISTALLQLAKELGIAIVLLAQINREGAKKGAARMEDVGDSYRISQDCDVFVIFRFKSQDEMDEDGPEMGNRHGFLDKNRGGRRGIGFSVLADEATANFKEAVREQSHPRAGRAGERQDDPSPAAQPVPQPAPDSGRRRRASSRR